MQTALATPELPRLTLVTPAAPRAASAFGVHASAQRLIVQCRDCGLQHDDQRGCPQCHSQTPHVSVIRPQVTA